MEIGLKAIWDLNDRVMSFQQVSEVFYCQFYSSFLRRILTVMTDCQHVSGFKLQCKIFQQLITVIETQGLVNQPIQMNSQPHTYNSNKAFVIDLLINVIMELFPNLNKMWVEALANRFFNNYENWKEFKGAVRDLMVSIRSFSAQGEKYYEWDLKQEKEKALKREQDKKNLIPGMKTIPQIQIEQLNQQ